MRQARGSARSLGHSWFVEAEPSGRRLVEWQALIALCPQSPSPRGLRQPGDRSMGFVFGGEGMKQRVSARCLLLASSFLCL